MPKGVQNEALWNKAMKQAKAGGYKAGSLEAVAMSIYKRKGGTIKTKQAVAASGQGALQRGKTRGKENTFRLVTAAGSSHRPLLESKVFPEWVRSQTFESLSDATTGTGTNPRIRCVLISEGPGNQRDKNYYTRQAIEDAAARGVFEGVRCYLNHQNEQEQMEHPVNVIENLAGFFCNTKSETVTGSDAVARLAITGELVPDKSAAGRELYYKALAQIEWKKRNPTKEECYAGLSINGGGQVRGTIDIGGDAWNQVVAFEGIESVDAVTRPARGGEFQAILESVQKPKPNGEEAMRLREMFAKIAKLEIAMLKESDPVKLEKLTEAKDDLVKHAMNKMAAMGGAKDEPAGDPEEGEGEDLPANSQGAPSDPEEGEGEGEDEGEGEGEAESEQMEALKGAIPQADGEEAEAYEARIKAAHQAAFGKKEAKKPKESVVPVRVSPKGNRLNEAALVELAGYRAAAKRAADVRLARKLLNESEMDERYCPVDTLVGKDEKTMRAHIQGVKNVMEDFMPSGGAFAPLHSAGARRGKKGEEDFMAEFQEAGVISGDEE